MHKNPLTYFKVVKLCLFSMLFLLSYTAIFSQLNKQLGTPFIKNFTEEGIKNNLKIYDISQNTNGEMYFATPAGLLEFDGIRWKSYKYGLESDLRSVFYKDDQHIYTSGHGGFGYWSKNTKGILEYTSLFFKEPKKKRSVIAYFF